MTAFNSARSCFLLCFAITSVISLTIESPGRNASKPDAGRSSVKTLSEPETASSSNAPIKSRILDGATQGTNVTSNVTIKNDCNLEEEASPAPTSRDASKLLQCPPSTRIMDFKPSTHIGEIEDWETRNSGDIDKHRFGDTRSIEFESTVAKDESVDTDRARVPTSYFRSNEGSAGVIARTNKIPVKFSETDGRYRVTVPVDVLHHLHRHDYHEPHQIHLPVQQMSDDHEDGIIPDGDNDHNQYQSDNLGSTQDLEALVSLEYPRSQGYVTSRPVVSYVSVAYPSTPKEPLPIHYEHQHYNIPSDNVYSVHPKPSKLHDDTATPSPNVAQLYEYSPVAIGTVKKPEVHGFYHQTGNYRGGNHHQEGNYHQDDNFQQAFAQEHSSDQIGKPETLYYVTSHRESAVTRMRKFPYQFYEPSVTGHQDNEYHYGLHEIPYTFPGKERRISPWKKIFHLIGAFLPLGLLLATLKPNVVKIENTTQPNIVLSKLRVVDLPVEHKRGGLADDREDKFQQDTCDDRFICELIVSGSEPSSNLLHNVLWNLTNKSTEEEAQKHGLYEIFSAAKKKDCSSIDC